MNSGKKLFEDHAVFNLSIGINDIRATVLDLGQVLKVEFESKGYDGVISDKVAEGIVIFDRANRKVKEV